MHLPGLHIEIGKPGLNGFEIVLLHLIQHLILQQIAQGAHRDHRGGQPLLTINHVVLAAIFHNDDRANDVATGLFRSRIKLIGDISEELLHLIVHFPDVFPLVIGYEKVVIPEPFNGVNLSFDVHDVAK